MSTNSNNNPNPGPNITVTEPVPNTNKEINPRLSVSSQSSLMTGPGGPDSDSKDTPNSNTKKDSKDLPIKSVSSAVNFGTVSYDTKEFSNTTKHNVIRASTASAASNVRQDSKDSQNSQRSNESNKSQSSVIKLPSVRKSLTPAAAHAVAKFLKKPVEQVPGYDASAESNKSRNFAKSTRATMIALNLQQAAQAITIKNRTAELLQEAADRAKRARLKKGTDEWFEYQRNYDWEGVELKIRNRTIYQQKLQEQMQRRKQLYKSGSNSDDDLGSGPSPTSFTGRARKSIASNFGFGGGLPGTNTTASSPNASGQGASRQTQASTSGRPSVYYGQGIPGLPLGPSMPNTGLMQLGNFAGQNQQISVADSLAFQQAQNLAAKQQHNQDSMSGYRTQSADLKTFDIITTTTRIKSQSRNMAQVREEEESGGSSLKGSKDPLSSKDSSQSFRKSLKKSATGLLYDKTPIGRIFSKVSQISSLGRKISKDSNDSGGIGGMSTQSLNHKSIFQQQEKAQAALNNSSNSFSQSRTQALLFIVQCFLFTCVLSVAVVAMILLYDTLEHFMNVYWFMLAGDINSSKIYFCLHAILGTSLASAFCNYFVKTYFAECTGAGTDATRIAMAISSPITIKTAFARICLSSIYLGMGMPLGMEAPILHVTACTASFVLGLGIKMFPKYMHWRHLSCWVLVGVTSGLAAAFQAPLAGITYAVEEFVHYRKLGLAVTLIGLASSISNILMVKWKAWFDKYIIDVTNHHPYVLEPPEMYYMVPFSQSIFMGVTTAILGHIFCESVIQCRRKFRLISSPGPNKIADSWKICIFTGCCVGILGSVAFLHTNEKAGAFGIGMVIFAKILCVPYEQEYNHGVSKYPDIPYDKSLAPMENDDYLTWDWYLILFLTRYCGAIICASTGGPGGIFYPSLLIGGLMGGFFATVSADWDQANADQHRILIYMGTAGFFTSINRTSLTALMICYELTGLGKKGLDMKLTFPILNTALISHLLSEHLQHIDLATRMMGDDSIDIHMLYTEGLHGFFNNVDFSEMLNSINAIKEKFNSAENVNANLANTGAGNTVTNTNVANVATVAMSIEDANGTGGVPKYASKVSPGPHSKDHSDADTNILYKESEITQKSSMDNSEFPSSPGDGPGAPVTDISILNANRNMRSSNRSMTNSSTDGNMGPKDSNDNIQAIISFNSMNSQQQGSQGQIHHIDFSNLQHKGSSGSGGIESFIHTPRTPEEAELELIEQSEKEGFQVPQSLIPERKTSISSQQGGSGPGAVNIQHLNIPGVGGAATGLRRRSRTTVAGGVLAAAKGNYGGKKHGGNFNSHSKNSDSSGNNSNKQKAIEDRRENKKQKKIQEKKNRTEAVKEFLRIYYGQNTNGSANNGGTSTINPINQNSFGNFNRSNSDGITASSRFARTSDAAFQFGTGSIINSNINHMSNNLNLTAAEISDEIERQMQNQIAEKEAELVQQFLSKYNMAQRILLISASRALVTEEKVLGGAIVRAAKDCDVVKLHEMLRGGQRILDAPSILKRFNVSLLHLMIKHNAPNAVHMLLHYGVSATMQNQDHISPLMYAIESQPTNPDLAIVKLLIDYKARIWTVDKRPYATPGSPASMKTGSHLSGRNALHCAAINGHEGLIHLMLNLDDYLNPLIEFNNGTQSQSQNPNPTASALGLNSRRTDNGESASLSAAAMNPAGIDARSKAISTHMIMGVYKALRQRDNSGPLKSLNVVASNLKGNSDDDHNKLHNKLHISGSSNRGSAASNILKSPRSLLHHHHHPHIHKSPRNSNVKNDHHSHSYYQSQFHQSIQVPDGYTPEELAEKHHCRYIADIFKEKEASIWRGGALKNNVEEYQNLMMFGNQILSRPSGGSQSGVDGGVSGAPDTQSMGSEKSNLISNLTHSHSYNPLGGASGGSGSGGQVQGTRTSGSMSVSVTMTTDSISDTDDGDLTEVSDLEH